jgi:hypothetical protein
VAGSVISGISDWLEPLRSMGHPRYLRITSELPPEKILQRIAGGLSGGPIVWSLGKWDDASEWRLHGFVHNHFVSVRAISRRTPRNDWRPEFTGRVTATASGGAELTGRLGVRDILIFITRAYLIFCAAFLVISITGCLVSIGTDHWASARPFAYTGCAAVGLCIFFIAVSATFIQRGRRDGEYLDKWLRQCADEEAN